jgi:hypothetical protein
MVFEGGKFRDALTFSTKDFKAYPSYTLAQLEEFVAKGEGNDKMKQEIEDRKRGGSEQKVTPQIEGGRAVPKIGRM